MGSRSSSTQAGVEKEGRAAAGAPQAPGPDPLAAAAAGGEAGGASSRRPSPAAQRASEPADQSQPASSGPPPTRRRNRFLVFAALPSWLTSTIVHTVALLLLALMSLAPEPARLPSILTLASERIEAEVEEPRGTPFDPVVVEPAALAPTPEPQSEPTVKFDRDEMANDLEVAVPLRLDFSQQTAPKESLLEAVVGGAGGLGFESRGAAKRGQMVRDGGGSPQSEAAVAAALAWLAEHQWLDGGWSFDHRLGRCQGRCPDPGLLARSRNAATAMALLPFLGAGQTHQKGDYKETVRKGLYFLTARKMKVIGERGDLSEEGGLMYSHGLAAIALCEAFGMTRDNELMRPAQLAINHIVYAQDPVGGGWRYFPQDAGDTSVVGWQLMALKSAHLSYLRVPRETAIGASRFLDFVQLDGGAIYGYRRPGDRVPETDAGTTAVGLLCRMYLGWERENPALQRGVQLLAKLGPSQDNMYYNYYATQVMRHQEGEQWETWNGKMRDFLISSQANRNHLAGSWYFQGEPLRGDRGAMQGGRLYFTSLAAMILEVYYRYMPIYGRQAVEEDFPL